MGSPLSTVRLHNDTEYFTVPTTAYGGSNGSWTNDINRRIRPRSSEHWRYTASLKVFVKSGLEHTELGQRRRSFSTRCPWRCNSTKSEFTSRRYRDDLIEFQEQDRQKKAREQEQQKRNELRRNYQERKRYLNVQQENQSIQQQQKIQTTIQLNENIRMNYHSQLNKIVNNHQRVNIKTQMIKQNKNGKFNGKNTLKKNKIRKNEAEKSHNPEINTKQEKEISNSQKNILMVKVPKKDEKIENEDVYHKDYPSLLEVFKFQNKDEKILNGSKEIHNQTEKKVLTVDEEITNLINGIQKDVIDFRNTIMRQIEQKIADEKEEKDHINNYFMINQGLSEENESEIIQKFLKKLKIIETNFDTVEMLKEFYKEGNFFELDILSVVTHCLQLILGIKMRFPQIIALLSLYQRKNSIIQVLPGEGKTYICMIFAVFINLTSQKQVDVLTSAENLAEREANNELYQRFFNFFGLKVACVTSEHRKADELRKIFSSDIVYSTSNIIQANILSDVFFGDDRLNNRKQFIVIVDEVDNMFIDKSTYSCQISIPTFGMDFLSPVFFYIYQAIQNYILLSDSVLCDIQGLVDFSELIQSLNSETQYLSSSIEKFKLDNQQIIDQSVCLEICNALEIPHIVQNNKGEFICLRYEQDELCLLTDCYNRTGFYLRREKQESLNFIHEEFKQSLQELAEQESIYIPDHFKEFVDNRLLVLICNAMYSKNLIRDCHYTIVKNQIVVIDFQNTGEYQFNLTWSFGLAQFIQIRENIPVEMETLSAVSQSLVSFFNGYEVIYGMSGTLGTEHDRKTLQDFYKIKDLINIPPFKPKILLEEEMIVENGHEQWINRIKLIVNEVKEDNRCALVICETKNQVEELSKIIKDSIPIYKKNQIQDFSEKILQSRDVIISTNIGARGCDFKIDENVNENGGMKILITFIPINQRVEDQAKYRTARNGQKGSFQFVVEDMRYHINTWRKDRDENYANQIEQIKNILIPRNQIKDRLCKLYIEFMKKHQDNFQRYRGGGYNEKYYLKQLFAQICDTYDIKNEISNHMNKTNFKSEKQPLEKVNTTHKNIDEIYIIEEDTFQEINYLAQKEDNIHYIYFLDKQKNFQHKVILRFYENSLQNQCQIEGNEKGYWMRIFLILYKNHKNENDILIAVKCSNNCDNCYQRFNVQLNLQSLGEIHVFSESQEKQFQEFVDQNENLVEKQQEIFKNPLFYIKQGNDYLKQDNGYACSSYDKAIQFGENSIIIAPAYIYKAAVIVDDKWTDYKSISKDYIKKAIELLNKQVNIYKLLAIQTTRRNQKGESLLTEYLAEKINAFTMLIHNLESAVQQLEQEGTVDVYIVNLSDLYQGKDINNQILGELFNLGFKGGLEIKKRPNLLGAILCAVIGFCQVVAGAALVAFSAGALASFGQGLLQEGVSDMIYGIQGIIKGDFDWKEWGIQKAISIAISLVAAGVSKAASKVKQIVKAKQLSKEGAKQIGKEGAKSLTKEGASTLSKEGVNTLNKEGAKQLNKEGIKELSKNEAKDLLKQKFKDCGKIIGGQLVQTGISVMASNLTDKLIEEFLIQVKDSITAKIQTKLLGDRELENLIFNLIRFHQSQDSIDISNVKGIDYSYFVRSSGYRQLKSFSNKILFGDNEKFQNFKKYFGIVGDTLRSNCGGSPNKTYQFLKQLGDLARKINILIEINEISSMNNEFAMILKSLIKDSNELISRIHNLELEQYLDEREIPILNQFYQANQNCISLDILLDRVSACQLPDIVKTKMETVIKQHTISVKIQSEIEKNNVLNDKYQLIFKNLTNEWAEEVSGRIVEFFKNRALVPNINKIMVSATNKAMDVTIKKINKFLFKKTDPKLLAEKERILNNKKGSMLDIELMNDKDNNIVFVQFDPNTLQVDSILVQPKEISNSKQLIWLGYDGDGHVYPLTMTNNKVIAIDQKQNKFDCAYTAFLYSKARLKGLNEDQALKYCTKDKNIKNLRQKCANRVLKRTDLINNIEKLNETKFGNINKNEQRNQERKNDEDNDQAVKRHSSLATREDRKRKTQNDEEDNDFQQGKRQRKRKSCTSRLSNNLTGDLLVHPESIRTQESIDLIANVYWNNRYNKEAQMRLSIQNKSLDKQMRDTAIVTHQSLAPNISNLKQTGLSRNHILSKAMNKEGQILGDQLNTRNNVRIGDSYINSSVIGTFYDPCYEKVNGQYVDNLQTLKITDKVLTNNKLNSNQKLDCLQRKLFIDQDKKFYVISSSNPIENKQKYRFLFPKRLSCDHVSFEKQIEQARIRQTYYKRDLSK